MSLRLKEKKITEVKKNLEQTENALCGMEVSYTMDLDTGLVVSSDVANKGEGKKCKYCVRCPWRAICNPTAVRVDDITSEINEILFLIDDLKDSDELDRIKDKIIEHQNAILELFDEAKAIRLKELNKVQKILHDTNEHLKMVPENEF